MQDLNIYKNSYLIIGGPNSKKSSISRILSKKLNLKLINLDREKYSYFEDFTDFDLNKYYSLIENVGNLKALSYIHKYEIKHLEYILDNLNNNVVIDFGNTYLIIDEVELLNRLKMFENVILLNKNNNNNITELDEKLYRNKILQDLKTIKIDIDNKDDKEIINEILNNKNYKEVL